MKKHKSKLSTVTWPKQIEYAVGKPIDLDEKES
jgi:hypothetical protein